MKADMWPIARHDDVDALHRDAAARRGIALDDEQAAAAGGAGRLAGIALDDTLPDIMFSATPGPAWPCTVIVASCSCRRSSSRHARIFDH
jgi:hypothetical protein